MYYITTKNYNKCMEIAKQAIESIPKAHNRKRIKKENEVLKQEVIKYRQPLNNLDIKLCDGFVFEDKQNLGTNRFTDYFTRVNIWIHKIQKTTDKCIYISDYTKYRKSSVLAYVVNKEV